MDRFYFCFAHLEFKIRAGKNSPFQRTLQGQHGSRRLRIAQIGQHQRVAVDDPGRGRVQRGDAAQRRLHAHGFGRRDFGHVGNPVFVRSFLDSLQLGNLACMGRDDQLAAAPVRDPVLVAVGVEALAPLDAGARLERPLRVVDPGVDDLGIARAGVGADRFLGLEDHHLAAGPGQRPRHREPDHAGPDHDAFDLVHELRFLTLLQGGEHAGTAIVRAGPGVSLTRRPAGYNRKLLRPAAQNQQ